MTHILCLRLVYFRVVAKAIVIIAIIYLFIFVVIVIVFNVVAEIDIIIIVFNLSLIEVNTWKICITFCYL